MRRIESLTRTYVCVLQEKLGCKVDSKSVVLPWLVRHAAYVLSNAMIVAVRGTERQGVRQPVGTGG